MEVGEKTKKITAKDTAAETNQLAEKQILINVNCELTEKSSKNSSPKINRVSLANSERGDWHTAAHETAAQAEGTPRRKAQHETRLAATPGAHFPPGLAAAVKAPAARVSAPADPRGPPARLYSCRILLYQQ